MVYNSSNNFFQDTERNMFSHKIIKVSKTEFETSDGSVYPIPFELDETPHLEDFQEQYNHWLDIFISEGFITNEENDKHRQSRRPAGSRR